MTHLTPTAAHTGVQLYRGIRYAQPPIGALRFAPPVAHGTDGHAATGHTGIAPQSPSRLRNVMGDFADPQSEDCLNLSVWTPAADHARRPVLFWIHGGAFMSGAGALGWYDGSHLSAEGDLVVVSPNYRLGALGFLHQAGLSDGNLGLLDLELALQWVRLNIHRYGGDPDRITVMGQSAGAWSAALMVARMKAEAPSIHQLILQSGPLGVSPALPESATVMAQAFLHALAPGATRAQALQHARAASVPAILEAQGAAIRAIGNSLTPPGHPGLPFGPVADGRVVPGLADYRAYLAQAAGRVPVLVGWTRDEMSAFQAADPGSAEDRANAATARAVFETPSRQWASQARRAGRPAYAFSFDWAPSDSRFGACHCIELPFVFGSQAAFAGAPMLGDEPAVSIDNLSRRVRAAWLAFVRHGDPNAAGPQGLPDWPLVADFDGPVMHIDTRCHVSAPRTQPARSTPVPSTLSIPRSSPP
jgi:para-nitrobenzyl esterase